MNKILIFAKASEAILLIKKISENLLNIGEFHIVHEDDEIKTSFEKENLHFYKINFFAYELYKNLYYKDLNKIVIIVKNKKEAEFILKNSLDKKIPILFVKFWIDFNIPNQNNIEIINLPEIITDKIIDLLPGVPLFARDIGLGIGEILEVKVPPHSPYAYLNSSKIDNEKVKLAAIYRNNKLKLINKNSLILPNDKLLLIGEPKELKDLFYKIKKNIGSFPQPFGQNIYLLIDMKNMNKKEIYSLLKSALFLHRKLKNKKLIIKIINPSMNNQIYKLYKFNNIEIFTNYFESYYPNALQTDIKKYNIGLIITNNTFFYNYKDLFYKIKIPIFKKGEISIKKCKNIKISLQEEVKSIISIIFDIAFQISKPLILLEADPEKKYKSLSDDIINFSKLFNFKDINIKETQNNPIFELKKEENSCIIIPFNKKPIPKLFQILNPKMEYNYLLLNKLNQFLIPIS